MQFPDSQAETGEDILLQIKLFVCLFYAVPGQGWTWLEDRDLMVN